MLAMQLSHLEDRLADDLVTDLHFDGYEAHHTRLSPLQFSLGTTRNLAGTDTLVELERFAFRQPFFELRSFRWPIERRRRQREVVSVTGGEC